MMKLLCLTAFIALNSITTVVICNSSHTPPPRAKIYPEGKSTSIRDIIKNGGIYVDKTSLAFTMLTNEEPHISLFRPRQFGKSLFLNTLKEILEGNKELFKNCYIGTTNYNWNIKHIVLIFDFSAFSSKNEDAYEKSLTDELFRVAGLNNVFIEGPTMSCLLTNLLDELSKKIDNTAIHGIAVLIDEYDAPFIKNLDNLTLSKKIFMIMNTFFCILKSNVGSNRIKYTYVTGVSNFVLSTMSSGPNHITNKSFQPKYSTALGFTEDEIKQHFSDYIHHMVHTRSKPENKLTEKNILEEMCTWYKGYFFSEDTSPKNAIFNPRSIKQYFVDGHPEKTWSMNDGATWLKHELRKHSLEEVLKTCYLTPKPIPVRKIYLQSSSIIDDIKLLPLLYYHGYYTIKEYKDRNYYLDFPNLEVKDAFYEDIGLAVEDWEKKIMELKNSLEILDLKQFFDTLNNIFLCIPSTLYDPQSTKRAFYVAMEALLTGAGIPAESEYTYSTPDIVVQLKNRVIVFELNMVGENEMGDKVVEEALDRAKNQKHVQVFLHKQKPVTLVGVYFKTADRAIGWKAIYYSESGEEIEQTASP